MNDMAIHNLEMIGRLLLAVHKLPQVTDFARFQVEALGLLSRTLPFDSAWWGLASGLNIHTEIKFNLPVTYGDDWETVKFADPIAAKTIATPFTTCRFNANDLLDVPALQTKLKKYDIHHVLCTRVEEEALGLHAFLSIYRSDPPFSDAEMILKQTVMPHLIHALHLSWRKHLETALLDASANNELVSNAVVDKTGQILSADDLFARFIALEWPHWRGPTLPESLRQSMRMKRDTRTRKLHVTFRDVSGVTLVRLMERRLVAELSERELAVAERYAMGKTHKLIAQELSIAPATVRHYIRTTFHKLQIHNKAELTRLIFGAKV